MKSELLATSPLVGLALIALFLFLGIFAIAVAVTFSRKKSGFDAVAALPLEGDES